MTMQRKKVQEKVLPKKKVFFRVTHILFVTANIVYLYEHGAPFTVYANCIYGRQVKCSLIYKCVGICFLF